MALDKDVAKFLENYNTAGHPPYSSYTPVTLRKKFNDDFSKKTQAKPIDVAEIKTCQIPSDAGMLLCRIYYPQKKLGRVFPALMYFHGGGFVIRDNMDIYDQTCRMMCAGANCVVIAVDFRLAPEYPFPAAPEDCYAATCWVAEHAAALHINPNCFGVWGESCGGNLAGVVAMMARDRGGPRLACQIIITAMLDYNFTRASYKENGQGQYFLTEDSMRWFWGHYLADAADAKNPYCAPLQASNLSDLPKALVVVAQYDPLRDEGREYAKKLANAGVVLECICLEGLIHGFFDLYQMSAGAKQACQRVIGLVKQMLDS